MIADGKVKPVMDQSFGIEDAAAAHARLEKGSFGGSRVDW